MTGEECLVVSLKYEIANRKLNPIQLWSGLVWPIGDHSSPVIGLMPTARDDEGLL